MNENVSRGIKPLCSSKKLDTNHSKPYLTMRTFSCRECDSVEFLMDLAGGAISGGTVASLFGAVFDESGPDSKAVADPYGLNPPNSDRGPDKPDKFWGGYNKHLDAWYMPFVMGPINSRVVRRSNALMDYKYGEHNSRLIC